MANPPVRVGPTLDDTTHDVALADGSQKVGLMFLSDAKMNVLQEVPISPPSRPFTTSQSSWFGGARKLNFKDDPHSYFDAFNMWTMTDGQLFPRPIEKFATGHRDAEMREPGNMKFLKLLPTGRTYVSDIFTASATSNRGRIGVWLNYTGEPGALTIHLYSNDAGDPLLSLKSVTVTPTNANVYGITFVAFAAQAVVSGTSYHVVLQAASTDNNSNHWLVGVQAGGATAKRSANGTAWNATSFSLYYRVTDGDIARQWYHFNLYGAEYKVSLKDSRLGSSQIYINGDRGKATSATAAGASTLTDSSSGVSTGWTTDQWVGYKVRIINGAGDGQIRTIASNTGTVLTVSEGWDVALATTSEYIIYDGPIWQELTTPGLSDVTGRPAVANNIVFFPQGSTNIRKMHIDYTAATQHAYEDDGTNKAGLLEIFYDADQGLQLWAATYGSAALKYGTPSAWGAATTLTAITGTYVGTSDKNITNILGREAMYVYKEDSIWKIIKNRPVQINSGMEYNSSPYNGKAAAGGNNEIWWGWNHSLVRMVGSRIQDMLNFRQGWQGLPVDRMGIPMSACNAGGWWFFAMDGQKTKRSTVIVYNGFGYMELFRGWGSDTRIRNVYWMDTPEGRPKLYFDADGDSVFIEFPKYTSNPLMDTGLSHVPYAEIVTTIFDGGEPTLEKALNKIRLVLYGGGLIQGTVRVYYQVDDECGRDVRKGVGTWHYAGQMTGSQNLRTLKAQEFEVNFGSINRYRIKLEIYNESASNPIVVLGLDTHGDIFHPLQYRWIGTFKVDSNQITRASDPDFSPDFVLDFLRRAHEQGKILNMSAILPNLHNKAVVVANAPAPVYLWAGSEEGKARWGGYITVGLKEPG